MNVLVSILLKAISNPVITAVLGAIGGVLLTLASKFGGGFIDEYFEIRKQKHTKKVEAAEDINSFCIEGMHKGFRIRADSERHIKFRATEIEAIDPEVGNKLRHFLSAWSQHRNLLKKTSLTFEDEKLAKEFRDKAQKLGEELLNIARIWSK